MLFAIFAFLAPWIRDGKKSGMINPDYFFESLETVLGLEIFKFFYADPDPGFGIFLTLDPEWKDSDPGSGINIPDP
jgi:hypothetical protein